MRAYNLFVIVLLCVFIFLIDAAAYYWLQSILELIPSSFLTISLVHFLTLFHACFMFLPIDRSRY